jgi:preprotein translocase subunit SecB
MIEAKKAAFSFVDFKIPQFSYNESDEGGSELTIGYSPSGVYNSKTGEFELKLKFIANHATNQDDVVIDLTMFAKFRFSSAIEPTEIPAYFYKNAIAIAFPYLRSFISTLTLQANTKLLKLGLMNLSDLELPLKQNTVIV